MAPLCLLCLCAICIVAADQSKGWELRVTNSPGPVPRTCYPAPGLPPSARGIFYQAGPALFDGFDQGNWRYQSIFDGLGMVNRFELNPSGQTGQVCFTSAWMTTELYKDYMRNHTLPPRGVLFEDTEPPRTRCFMDMCDYVQAANDNNWVNMLVVGEELMWLSDTPDMVKMDPVTMNITGAKTWKNDASSMGHRHPDWVMNEHMAAGSSAHPIKRTGTQTVVEVMTEAPFVVGKRSVDVFTFDASVSGPQNRTLVSRIKADQPQYFHSFGVTPNYAILPFNLCNTGVGPGHKPTIVGKFHRSWKGIYVVNLDDGSNKLYDDMDPFYHVHIANSFENATGIVVDMGTYDDIPFSNGHGVLDIEESLNQTLRDSKPGSLRSQMRRYHFNNVTGKTTVRILTEEARVHDYDFIKVNPAFEGLPYCIYYAVQWYHNGVNYVSMAIMKHNICTGERRYWSKPNVYVNEPFFVASRPGGAEDEGTLFFTANDGEAGKAILVALNAQTFEELERVQLPTHLPFQAHGQFLASAPEILVV